MTDFVNLNGFIDDLDEVVQKYFDHFNIDVKGTDLPRELLRHPLSLRIFCSVANPNRDARVQLVDLPRSLNEMFDKYLLEVAHRIDELHPSIDARDVVGALETLGVEMWQTGTREVDADRVRQIFGDTGRRWDESILHALEHEGVLIRQPAQDTDAMPDGSGSVSGLTAGGGLAVAVVYDLLAGHIVASAIVRTGGSAFTRSLGTRQVTDRFAGDEPHPLAFDIFEALAFVLPRAGRGQLWEFVDNTLTVAALLRTTRLGADTVDVATVEAWEENISSLLSHPDLWPMLQATRAVPDHPLNSVHLHALLQSMSVADRDLSWTEWLRENAGQELADARAMKEHWQSSSERTETDQLRARWLIWTLTSTVRDLRDAATAALYWYGRDDAAGLFALALDALAVNDSYVGERAAAAAYGVATAHQLHDREFGNHLARFLDKVLSVVGGDAPTAPTFHRLTRYYIAGTVEFARTHYPDSVPSAAVDGIEFAPGALPEALRGEDERREEVDRTIHLDFGNYTLGRLFEGRNNYDYEHEGHLDATDRVLGVVFNLGWRQDRFESVDSSIARGSRDSGPGRVDRYGKKYGWIGFYLVSGMLNDRGERVYWLEVDIDPTFPLPSTPLPLDVATWARPTPKDDRRWLKNGVVTIPDDLMRCDTLDGAAGPWILVHAEVDTKDTQTGRSGYGLFNTVAIDEDCLDGLMQWWSTIEHPGRDLIDLPRAHYLFAGEIPWHPRMVTSGDDIAGAGTRISARQQPDDDWVDPHDAEDPYVDAIRFYDNDSTEAVMDGPLKGGSDFDPADDERTETDWLEAARERWRYEQRPHKRLVFESLAHSYAWEGHNSSENQEFAYVPSQRLSKKLGLRAVPAGFDQTDSDGRPAAKSFSAPAGFEGHLLYIREDLLEVFAGGRAMVTFGFGERQIHMDWPGDIPDRIRNVYRDHDNLWRTHRIVSAPVEAVLPSEATEDDI